jgi:excisionase family DNA binding protein
MREKLLTTREASQTLNISEKDIIDLANANLLPHFKVAGEFLRFRKDDILRVRDKIRKKYNIPEQRVNRKERMREFFYFNDFYIACSVVIVVLLFVILKDLHF